MSRAARVSDKRERSPRKTKKRDRQESKGERYGHYKDTVMEKGETSREEKERESDKGGRGTNAIQNREMDKTRI